MFANDVFIYRTYIHLVKKKIIFELYWKHILTFNYFQTLTHVSHVTSLQSFSSGAFQRKISENGIGNITGRAIHRNERQHLLISRHRQMRLDHIWLRNWNRVMAESKGLRLILHSTCKYWINLYPERIQVDTASASPRDQINS